MAINVFCKLSNQTNISAYALPFTTTSKIIQALQQALQQELQQFHLKN